MLFGHAEAKKEEILSFLTLSLRIQLLVELFLCIFNQFFIDFFTSLRHTKDRNETEHCAAMGYKGSLSGQIFTGKESIYL